MKQRICYRNVLRSLVSSTVILRFCFGCISLFGSLLGLYVEHSVIYNAFNTGIGGITDNKNILFVVAASSVVLMIDAMISFTSIMYKTKFLKLMRKILLKIRLVFWIPGIFVSLCVSYYNAHYAILNDHISNIDAFIVSGYYLSITILGVFSLLNESIVANNTAKEDHSEKN